MSQPLAGWPEKQRAKRHKRAAQKQRQHWMAKAVIKLLESKKKAS